MVKAANGAAPARLGDSAEYAAAVAAERRVRDKASALVREREKILARLWAASAEGAADQIAAQARAIADGAEFSGPVTAGNPDALRTRLAAIRDEEEVLKAACKIAANRRREAAERIGMGIAEQHHMPAHRAAVKRLLAAFRGLEAAITDEREVRAAANVACGGDFLPGLDVEGWLRLGQSDVVRSDWERRAARYASEA